MKQRAWIVEVEVHADTEYEAKRNVENWRNVVRIKRTEEVPSNGNNGQYCLFGDHP